MKAKRRRHDPEFKARVALEAIRGIKTVQQTGKEFDVHPGYRSRSGKRPCWMGLPGSLGPAAARPERRVSRASAKNFNRRSDSARARLKERVLFYAKTAPKLAAWMEENVPESFTVYDLPEAHRRRMAAY